MLTDNISKNNAVGGQVGIIGQSNPQSLTRFQMEYKTQGHDAWDKEICYTIHYTVTHVTMPKKRLLMVIWS